MADPFVGEIRMFGGNFAPSGWALCNGQLLAIAKSTALFSLLGTQFGGDGRVTFGLPNLQAAVPMGQGQGPGLSDRQMGDTGGEPTHTLTTPEMAAHVHSYSGVSDLGATASPVGAFAAVQRSVSAYVPPNAPGFQPAVMSPAAIGLAGGSAPHNNMQPFQVITFIIATQGVFPSRQ